MAQNDTMTAIPEAGLPSMSPDANLCPEFLRLIQNVPRGPLPDGTFLVQAIPIWMFGRDVVEAITKFRPEEAQFIPMNVFDPEKGGCREYLRFYSKCQYPMLNNVPPQFLSQSGCARAVRLNPVCIGTVPKEFLHEYMCVDAVTEMPMVFNLIPEELQTPKVCAAAWRAYCDAHRQAPLVKDGSPDAVGVMEPLD